MCAASVQVIKDLAVLKFGADVFAAQKEAVTATLKRHDGVYVQRTALDPTAVATAPPPGGSGQDRALSRVGFPRREGTGGSTEVTHGTSASSNAPSYPSRDKDGVWVWVARDQANARDPVAKSFSPKVCPWIDTVSGLTWRSKTLGDRWQLRR